MCMYITLQYSVLYMHVMCVYVHVIGESYQLFSFHRIANRKKVSISTVSFGRIFTVRGDVKKLVLVVLSGT